jgi:hypothetical protein
MQVRVLIAANFRLVEFHSQTRTMSIDPVSSVTAFSVPFTVAVHVQWPSFRILHTPNIFSKDLEQVLAFMELLRHEDQMNLIAKIQEALKNERELLDAAQPAERHLHEA